jgi:RNA polymerase sigma-54 factor
MQHFHSHQSKQLTTAHLAQTMAMIQLTVDELRQEIEAQLAANPALELVEERRCPMCHKLLPPHGSCQTCSAPHSDKPDEPIVFVSPREDFVPGSRFDEADYLDEPSAPVVDDLPTFVLKQVALDLKPEQQRIAVHLVSNLDEDGLLAINLADVAWYFHVPVEEIKDVQRILQHAEPLGVCSSSTAEALLVQLEVMAERCENCELAAAMISQSMDKLSRHLYSELARQFNSSVAEVTRVAQFISDNLNPFPARSHWGDEHTAVSTSDKVYHQPDVIISYLNDDPNQAIVVEIISPIGGTLRVSQLYKDAIKSADEDSKYEMRTDMDRAGLFVKCLQQRDNTMLRLMSRLVVIQREYIRYGDKQLVPITRAQMAKELGVHESTMSRAVSSKAVQLPNRKIVPMSAFFERNMKVRTVLRELIETESKPFSDSELVDMLSDKGYPVARRTVAKYRAMEGILPAHLRKVSAR